MSQVGIYRAIAGQLRSSEQLKLAVQTRSLDGADSVIAIVCNIQSGIEEAALFIYKVMNLVPPIFRLSDCVAVEESLRISLAQTTAHPYGSSDSGLQSGTTEWLVKISSSHREEITFRDFDSLDINDIMSEVKRLRGLFFPNDESHKWLSYYISSISEHRAPQALRSDYRRYLRPVYPPYKLSPAAAGISGDEDGDIHAIQENWIRSQLQLRANEFSTKSKLSVRIGTWNVQSQSPTQILSPWIFSQSSLESPVDVYVFGFQELDTSTEALLYSSTTAKEDRWYESIVQDMGELSQSYDKLASKQLVGMLLIILVRKELRPHVSSISTTSAGVGILNTLGNKGGVGLRFRIHDTTLCFIDCHLAAFDEMVEKRNSDYQELSRRLLFPVLASTPAEAVLSPTQVADVFDCDCLFWMGDLNYRVDVPDPEIRALLEESQEGSIIDLMEFDQLNVQKKLGRCFPGFVEQDISFMPTYKVLSGGPAITYDMKRRPAWTDRILSWSPADLASPISYRSHPEISLSDHKPISAEYEVELTSIQWDQFNSVFEEILDLISASDIEDITPTLVLDNFDLDFGEIFYDVPKHVEVQLKNSGEVSAAFRFTSHQLAELIFPVWLTATPTSGFLLPGATTILSFTIHITKDFAPLFNIPKVLSSIQETAILHVEKGKDHFILFRGSFARTCFATDLITLSRLSTHARYAGDSISPAKKEVLTAPRELLRMINWLMINALTADDLFLKRGDTETIRSIREALDTGDDFPSISLPESVEETQNMSDDQQDTLSNVAVAMGDCLLSFLDSLVEPVIPPTLHQLCASAVDREQAFEVVSELTPVAANVFVSLTAFLHFFIQSQPESIRKPHLIASTFARVLLHRTNETIPPISPLIGRNFLMHFLI